jgi:hypothetical protein
MRRRGLWAACVVLLVGVGVLAVGTGFAKDEDDGAKCSEATLDGTYLFAQDGFTVKGDDPVPFAVAGYEDFHGNGEVDAVLSFKSANFNGDKIEEISKEPFSGTYTVKADCTGTTKYPKLAVKNDLFIAPDGSMFTFLQTEPPEDVTSGFDLQGTAKRVGD